MNMWWPQTWDQKSDARSAPTISPGIRKPVFARKRREQVREPTHAWQNGNVNFGVTEEPEQVLPQSGEPHPCAGYHLNSVITKPPGMKKLVPAIRSSSNKDASREQYTERQQSQDRGDKPRPAGQWQASQGHAFRAEVDPSVVINSARPSTTLRRKSPSQRPQGLTRALSGTRDFAERTQWRIGSPTANGSAAGYKECGC